LAPTQNKIATLIHHPHQCFCVVDRPPDPNTPTWPTVLAHHRL
jgi:hypothetical protein